MARLYKNGAEVARMEKKVVKYCEIYHRENTYTYTRAIMENGYILQKVKMTTPNEKPLDMGWKRQAKLKTGKTAQNWVEQKEKMGWVKQLRKF